MTDLIPFYRTCLMIGSSFYILYCTQLLFTSSIMMYTSAVLLGTGAALVWVSLGFLLASNSESQTRYRNCGLFWFLFHFSGILGNTLVFLEKKIKNSSDNLIAVFLLCFTSTGVVIMTMFKRTESCDIVHLEDWKSGSMKSISLLTSRKFLTLIPTFVFTGFMQTFQTSFQQNCCIGTGAICSAALSTGEMTAGIICFIIGYCSKKVKVVVFIMVFILSVLVHLVILGTTGHLASSSIFQYSVLVISAFLYGFVDGTYNLQIIVNLILDVEYSAASFGLFKFLQSLSTFTAYTCVNKLRKPWK